MPRTVHWENFGLLDCSVGAVYRVEGWITDDIEDFERNIVRSIATGTFGNGR